MKVRKDPKFPKKSFLVFDSKKRKDYITGFEKRKQERREKAKVYNEQKAKEAKRQQRAQRRKEVEQLMEKYEEDKQKDDGQWNNPSMAEESDSEEESEVYQASSGSAVLSDEIKTKCGSATVEISTLGLSSQHFLGQNTDFENCKPSIAILQKKYGHLTNDSKRKEDVTSQSFSDLVKGVMKKATKQAKKEGKIVSFVNKNKTSFKKDKSNFKNKKKTTLKNKKKPMVTEL